MPGEPVGTASIRYRNWLDSSHFFYWRLGWKPIGPAPPTISGGNHINRDPFLSLYRSGKLCTSCRTKSSRFGYRIFDYSNRNSRSSEVKSRLSKN